jgi:hypothetical protein
MIKTDRVIGECDGRVEREDEVSFWDDFLKTVSLWILPAVTAYWHATTSDSNLARK